MSKLVLWHWTIYYWYRASLSSSKWFRGWHSYSMIVFRGIYFPLWNDFKDNSFPLWNDFEDKPFKEFLLISSNALIYLFSDLIYTMEDSFGKEDLVGLLIDGCVIGQEIVLKTNFSNICQKIPLRSLRVGVLIGRGFHSWLSDSICFTFLLDNGGRCWRMRLVGCVWFDSSEPIEKEPII